MFALSSKSPLHHHRRRRCCCYRRRCCAPLTCRLLVWSLVAYISAVVPGAIGHGDDDPHANRTSVDARGTGFKESDGAERNRNPFYACPPNDQACADDPFGYEAIHLLHAQIDDDQNGNVDRDESNEFLRDDLKLQDDLAERTDLHGNDDLISVQDLWRLWSSSDAYKWTVDEVIDWLTVHVELPQYAINFRINDVNGRLLPRLTSFSSHSLLSIIGIKNAVHRQKLALKAADIVLFGSPKNLPNTMKDFALVMSLFVAVFGCYFSYFQHRRSQRHLQKVMRDLKALQRAEDALSQLQEQLKKAQTEQQLVTSAKHDVERKLKQEIETAKAEAERLRAQRETMAKEQISCLKLAEDELTQLRKALGEAERQLQSRTSFVSSDLQQWLQLTYEVETTYFEVKRTETEQQLKEAREMCDKIRRQKEKFLGSFQVAHTNSLDDTDDKIIRVRRALEDVKKDLQERSYRWKEIENICGFNIIMNPGIPYLNSLLHRSRFMTCPGQAFQHLKKQTSFFGIDTQREDGAGAFLRCGSNSPSSDLRRVVSSPGYANQQVLSNLMRAGMQLSAVGVNLSDVDSSQRPFRDSSPSPVSLPLHECKSTCSLASLASFSSLQPPFRQHATLAATPVDAGSRTGSVLPLATGDGDAAAEFKRPNSNGFLYHGLDDIKRSSDSSWVVSEKDSASMEGDNRPRFVASSLESDGRNSEKQPANDTEQDTGLQLEYPERSTVAKSRQKTKRPKRKSPFLKLLKSSIGKEKSS